MQGLTPTEAFEQLIRLAVSDFWRCTWPHTLMATMSGVTGLWPAILADTDATELVTISAPCQPTP